MVPLLEELVVALALIPISGQMVPNPYTLKIAL
jgi:hypothetical protein